MTQKLLHDLEQTHAQLLQSDKMASIGQLAAGVAHEINNPIGFIFSNLNSLDRYVKDLQKVLGACRELVDECIAGGIPMAAKALEIQRLCEEVDADYMISDLNALVTESLEGVNRVRQIVSDLRDFSHVDSPDINEEDINRLLDKTLNVASNEVKYKAQVVREYGKIPSIPCYGGKLGQVFLNLLINAAQAIPDHGTITVRTGENSGYVWIEIEDTGCGIPPENLNRVFDPFFTTKEVGKGTGMGLHLVYRIVEAHGGTVSVRSTVGQGTTFRVELPLAGPAGGAPDESADEARAGAGNPL
jgi:signal transduction histidine kinase